MALSVSRIILVCALILVLMFLVAGFMTGHLRFPFRMSPPERAIQTRYTLPDGSSFVLSGVHAAEEFPYEAVVTVEDIPR